MADPLGRAETRRLLDQHGIRLKRSLGQHFLVDPNIVRRIVDVARVGPGSRVVEIGAGAGTLTRALAASGATVVAYEVDERLAPVLTSAVGGEVELRFADAASVDFEVSLPPGEWVLVANLPYNVGTPMVLDLLQRVPRVTRFVVMLQKEAVDRLVAGPGSKTYGLPSVIAALHATARVALRVPASVFVPVPKVDSAVAVLERIAPDPASVRAISLAAAGFGQRRKMVRSSLRDVLAEPEAALRRAGIDPTARAESLGPAEWLRLAEAS